MKRFIASFAFVLRPPKRRPQRRRAMPIPLSIFQRKDLKNGKRKQKLYHFFSRESRGKEVDRGPFLRSLSTHQRLRSGLHFQKRNDHHHRCGRRGSRASPHRKQYQSAHASRQRGICFADQPDRDEKGA